MQVLETETIQCQRQYNTALDLILGSCTCACDMQFLVFKPALLPSFSQPTSFIIPETVSEDTPASTGSPSA